MTRRVPLIAGALVVVGLAFLVGARSNAAGQGVAPQALQDTAFVAPANVDTTNLPGPQQPIFYRHDVHAGQYRMDCRYCHFAAETSISPGLPTISTCMGCHRIVGLQNPEVQKLRKANDDKQPPHWVEVHKLPPFVHFPHMRHVTSDSGAFKGKTVVEKCETCHGPIRTMPQVYQYASLKMGWCVTCHKEAKVNTDCTACHY